MGRAFRLAALPIMACLLSSCVGKFSLIDSYHKGKGPHPPADPAGIHKELVTALSEEIATDSALIEMQDRGVVVTILDKVLFPSGKADIKPAGKEVLGKVAVVLEDIPNEISVEGHTDNEPIKKTRYLYKSNWELSTARAANVLHLLEERGIAPERMSATGYGEYRSVADNDTEEGRRRNRRVEIVILPDIIRQQIDADVIEEVQ